MVIGVGVDYALFIVTRHRRNLRRGMSVQDSIVAAINTSGRAVLFAGTTVCIAMLGLIALGVSFFYGMAIGTAIAVGLTMVASLTLLPALLELARPEGAAAQAAPARCAPASSSTRSPSDSGRAGRRSSPAATVALGAGRRRRHRRAGDPVLLAAARPRRPGQRPVGHHDPQGLRPDRAQGFGVGYNSDARGWSSTGPRRNRPGVPADASATTLSQPTGRRPDQHRTRPLNDTTLAFVSFKSTTSPQDAKTTTLVKHLRSERAAAARTTARRTTSTSSATRRSRSTSPRCCAAKMPLFIAAVVGLSFLLLMIAFRSVVMPLTAAVMNLFAAGASFGVVVAIFQWGWGSEALGVGKGGPIDAWAPVMFFAILFGLSMDYQVFLVSRMHEEWVHTKDNARAITVGQAETGGIITAAALIMIAVFVGFVLGDPRAIKLFGIGLASAVFLDAFMLRTVLVPSLMHLFGKANWYFPKSLERITPHVAIDADDAAEARGTVPVPRGDEDELARV